MSGIGTIAALVALAIIVAVGIEAYLKRNRKRRTFVETFKDGDTEDDTAVPLGMEEVDFGVIRDEERKATNYGLTNQTRGVEKTRRK